jgi:hypothetical protein
MDNTQLQKRIEILEKQIQSLNQSNTITYQVQNALIGRGFLNFDSLVVGYGQFGVAGEFVQVIPKATANSIVMATSVVNSTGLPIEAVIRASSTDLGSYEIYVQGVATDTFAYVVFLTTNLYTTL